MVLHNLPFYYGIPNDSRLVRQTQDEDIARFDLIARDGKKLSSVSLPRGVTGGASTSSDAVWLYVVPSGTTARHFVRIPFDSTTGKLAAVGDTVFSGRSTGMSVSGDGGTVVYDEGATNYSGWALPFNDLLTNKFGDRPVATATGGLRGSMSLDGAISVIGRESPQGGSEFSVVPFGSGREISLPGRHQSAHPQDSTTVRFVNATDSSTILSLFDFRTKRTSASRVVNGVGLNDITRIPGGWAWIPVSGRTIEIQRDDEPSPRRLDIPKWYKRLFWISGSPDGRIAYVGWQGPGEDSLGVGIFTPADNRFEQMFATFGEDGGTAWLDDGSLLAIINDTQESETFYLLKKGKQPQRLGSTPRPISSAIVTVSKDLKRAFVITKDDRRDVWTSKVVR